MLILYYLFGTTQAKTISDIHTITETNRYEGIMESLPDDYIPLDECIPLDDIAYCFIDGYRYICFNLKNIGNQLDNPNNKRYEDIIDNLTDGINDF